MTTLTTPGMDLLPPMFESWAFRAGLDGDDLWVAAPDVARILGYREAYDMTRHLDADEKGPRPVRTLGGEQMITTLTEAGLYSAIMHRQSGRIDDPETRSRVRRFQRWVTHEVLPSIRKRGIYATVDTVEAMLADPSAAIRLLTELQTERQERQALAARVEADAPKVLFADAVATSDTTILVGDLAKILRGNGIEVGANRLFDWLRRDGFLISRKGSDWNSPTQRAMDLGLFRIKETAVTHSDGHVTVNKTSKVTGKGQSYFVNRYAGAIA